MSYGLVTIGASWGGLNALQRVLGALPGDFAAPVVVAQHRSARADDTLLATLLGQRSELEIRDADDKDELRPGLALIAPPDYHTLVDRGVIALSCDEPVAFSRPSIDVLFESAADAYGSSVIGVVLTGSNADGSQGLAAIQRRGGLAVVQDPETAERPEMPQAALDAVPAARVLPLEQIAPMLTDVVGTARRRASA
jgi:two-component system chemotaxis response regulator CheB